MYNVYDIYFERVRLSRIFFWTFAVQENDSAGRGPKKVTKENSVLIRDRHPSNLL